MRETVAGLYAAVHVTMALGDVRMPPGASASPDRVSAWKLALPRPVDEIDRGEAADDLEIVDVAGSEPFVVALGQTKHPPPTLPDPSIDSRCPNCGDLPKDGEARRAPSLPMCWSATSGCQTKTGTR